MSSELGQSRKCLIEKRLKNLQYKNLHSVLQERQNDQILRKTRHKIQNTLESIRETDHEIFYQVPFFGNLLTVLYLDDDNDEDASELNNKILELFPDDKTALQNKVAILLDNEELHEAEKVLQMIEDNQNSKFHYCSCLVDEAFLYYNFPPKFYSKAVKLFCQALKGVEKIKSEGSEDGTDLDEIFEMEKMALVWKYYLIVTYNRLINSGNIMTQQLADGEERLTPMVCFSKIYTISKDMMNSSIFQTNKTYIARTLVEVYDAHFKMKFPLLENKCVCCVCANFDELFKTVLSPCDDDNEGATLTNQISTEGVTSPNQIPTEGPTSLANRIPTEGATSANKVLIIQDTSLDCLLKHALLFAPKDGHVLEKYGRNKRTKSKSLADFEEAESLLKECIDLYPGRYVAWHQLGLTYMNMWKYQLQENRQVYDNPIRTGKQKKPKGRKKKKKHCDPLDGYFDHIATQMAKSQSQAADNEKDEQKTSRQPQSSRNEDKENIEYKQKDCSQQDTVKIHPKNENERKVVKNESKVFDIESKVVENESKVVENESKVVQNESKAVKNESKVVQNESKVPETEVVLVQPKYPTCFGTLPKHHKNIDWFDHFRANNPQYEGDTIPELLKKALECFQKANDLVNDNQCRLLIDLGRCLVSMKRSKEGEKCFKRGSKCKTATEHELAYVYEQWALVLHEQHLEDVFTDKKICNKVKNLYRQSVENSVTAKEKSKVAFYNLRKILSEETDRSPDDLCAKKEYALLEKVVENFDKAKKMIHKILSVEGWKHNEELRHLGWDLVEIFYKIEQSQDAWSYMNMNLLLTADKSKSQLILNVGLNAAKEIQRDYVYDLNNDTINQKDKHEDNIDHFYGPVCVKSQEIYKKVFTTLISIHQFPNRTISMVNFSDQEKEIVMTRCTSADNKLNIQPHHVTLVMDNPDYQLAGYEEVKELLNYCGLEVKGEEDITFGTRLALTTLQDYSEHSTSVLIFIDDIDKKELLKMTAWNIVLNRKKFSQPVACIRFSSNIRQCEFLKKSKLPCIDVRTIVNEISARRQILPCEMDSSEFSDEMNESKDSKYSVQTHQSKDSEYSVQTHQSKDSESSDQINETRYSECSDQMNDVKYSDFCNQVKQSTDCECSEETRDAMIYEIFRTLCIDCFDKEYK